MALIEQVSEQSARRDTEKHLHSVTRPRRETLQCQTWDSLPPQRRGPHCRAPSRVSYPLYGALRALEKYKDGPANRQTLSLFRCLVMRHLLTPERKEIPSLLSFEQSAPAEAHSHRRRPRSPNSPEASPTNTIASCDRLHWVSLQFRVNRIASVSKANGLRVTCRQLQISGAVTALQDGQPLDLVLDRSGRTTRTEKLSAELGAYDRVGPDSL